MTEHVDVTVADRIMIVTLLRGAKKNAITAEMYESLSTALDDAERDPDIKVVLLQGEGETFCAGNDLVDFAASARSTAELPAARFIRSLIRASKPFVAAVQGNAVGIGTTMLLHCDLVYLADNAKLMAPFAGLGLVPEAASSLLLPTRIGHARAFAMFALGEPMDATRAVACGLANAALPLEAYQAAALAAARKLTKGSFGAIKETKKLMRDVEELGAQAERELRILGERVRGPDVREAITAFGERRPPVFADA